jgi:hypothetical protein
MKFVGTQKSFMPCTGTYDGDHEGHSGFEAIGIANYKLLPGWLDQVKPVDIVMMLLGTNDVVCKKIKVVSFYLEIYSGAQGKYRTP